MSRQFDVIELLANESLTHLPLNVSSEVYRMFDKCIRIYSTPGEESRLRLHAPAGYSGRVQVCDKTFSIIPSVLIENALKYSIPGTPINIEVFSKGRKCVVQVSNRAKTSLDASDAVFKKGVRLSADRDGSGNGLYLAKLIAAQHRGDITLTTKPISADVMEWTFTVGLPEFPE